MTRLLRAYVLTSGICIIRLLHNVSLQDLRIEDLERGLSDLSYLDVAVSVEEDVLGLDVTVDDVVVVKMLTYHKWQTTAAAGE